MYHATQQISNRFNSDWAAVRRSNQPLVNLLFTPSEQAQIGSLAQVSGRIANRTVNRSNTTSAAMAIGAGVGRLYNSLGIPVATNVIANILSTTVGPAVRAGRAKAATMGTMTPPRISPLIIGGASSLSADPEAQQKASDVIEKVPYLGPSIAPILAPNYGSPAPAPTPVAPPQAGVQPTASPAARGLPFMTNQQAAVPMPPQPAPASPQARQMLQQLFPDDSILQAATRPV